MGLKVIPPITTQARHLFYHPDEVDEKNKVDRNFPRDEDLTYYINKVRHHKFYIQTSFNIPPNETKKYYLSEII